MFFEFFFDIRLYLLVYLVEELLQVGPESDGRRLLLGLELLRACCFVARVHEHVLEFEIEDLVNAFLVPFDSPLLLVFGVHPCDDIDGVVLENG